SHGSIPARWSSTTSSRASTAEATSRATYGRRTAAATGSEAPDVRRRGRSRTEALPGEQRTRTGKAEDSPPPGALRLRGSGNLSPRRIPRGADADGGSFHGRRRFDKQHLARLESWRGDARPPSGCAVLRKGALP